MDLKCEKDRQTQRRGGEGENTVRRIGKEVGMYGSWKI